MYYPELHLRHEDGHSISAVRLTIHFTEEFLEDIASFDSQNGKDFLKEQLANHFNNLDYESMIDSLIEDAIKQVQEQSSRKEAAVNAMQKEKTNE
jgi:hypothetical protein